MAFWIKKFKILKDISELFKRPMCFIWREFDICIIKFEWVADVKKNNLLHDFE